MQSPFQTNYPPGTYGGLNSLLAWAGAASQSVADMDPRGDEPHNRKPAGEATTVNETNEQSF